MRRIRVKLAGRKDDSYTVFVQSGLLDNIPSLLPEAASYAIISDRRVADLYGGKLARNMRRRGLKCRLVSFPAGERSKSRTTKARIENELFAGNLGRDGCIIALGGGVTGDLAGFVAATYMRGVPYVQAPTSLLAMVDSSVGGKVAVDVPAGKNMVGAFYQPSAVFIDPLLLRTLPVAQLRAGLAEVIKHAVLADDKLFRIIEKKAEKLLEADPEALEGVLAKNCAIKAGVVSQDEREGNLRQVLNYGHTIAHAVEKLSSYRTNHGEAVALGMAVEADIASRLKIFSNGDMRRQNELLHKMGFKLKLPKGVKPTEIMKVMRLDKKVRAGKVRMALPERIGKMHKTKNGQWACAPTPKTVRAALEKFT